MKALRLLFFLVLISTFYYAQAQIPQNNIKEIMKQKITTMLITDGILPAIPINPNQGRRYRDYVMLRDALIAHYPLPNIYSQENISHTVLNRNINALGSLIFNQENLQLDLIPERIDQIDLSFLPDSPQMPMSNLNQSHFELFINSASIYAKVLKGNNAFNTPFFNEKASIALKRTTERHLELNFAVGTFKNELAILMEKVSSGSHLNDREWLPILNLWKYYSRQGVDRTGYILKSFTGMIAYELRDVDDERSKYINMYSAVGFRLPFLSAQAETNLNWQRNENFRASETSYDIYMIREPNSTRLPGYDKILDLWNLLKTTCNIEKYNNIDESQRAIILEPGRPAEVLFEFGPIPREYLNDVSIDWDYTINSLGSDHIIEIENGQYELRPEFPSKKSEGNYIYKLKIYRNEVYFGNLPPQQCQRDSISKRINFRLRFNIPISVNGSPVYLQREYNNIEVISTTKPNFHLADFHRHSIIENNKYIWNIPILIEPRQITNAITNVRTEEWTSLDGRFAYLKDSFPTQLHGGGTNWELKLSLPLIPNSVTNNEYIKFNGVLLITEAGRPPVKRSFLLSLIPPPEIVIADSKMNFESFDNLLKSLNTSALINDNAIQNLYYQLNNEALEAEAAEHIKFQIKDKLLQNKTIDFDIKKGYFIDKKLLKAAEESQQ